MARRRRGSARHRSGVVDNREDWDRILAQLGALDGLQVTAGIHTADGVADVVDARGARTGPKVIEIVAANEFGTNTIPERPAMRNAFRDHHKAWAGQFVADLRRVLDPRRPTLSPAQIAKRLGQTMRIDLKQTVNDFDDPANAPLTIALKGFDDPLIETRRNYYNRIRYEARISGIKVR